MSKEIRHQSKILIKAIHLLLKKPLSKFLRMGEDTKMIFLTRAQ